ELVAHESWTSTRRKISSTAVGEVVATLSARARYDGPQHDAHVRLTGTGEWVCVDLCNEIHEVAVISRDGFEITNRSPARFIRKDGMLELPRPTPAKDASALLLLKELLGLADATFYTVVAYLIGVFCPSGGVPPLVVTGPQGSGKSTLVH